VEPQIKAAYIDTGKVKLVWHHFAWIGAESRRASEASSCAHEQGKFWEYHNHLYHSQRGYNGGAFSDANLRDHAATLGLDQGAFATCMDNSTYAAAVQRDFDLARSQNLRSTPSFLVNGQIVVGAQSFDRWSVILDAAIKEATSKP